MREENKKKTDPCVVIMRRIVPANSVITNLQVLKRGNVQSSDIVNSSRHLDKIQGNKYTT
jgi:hypothetical protein